MKSKMITCMLSVCAFLAFLTGCGKRMDIKELAEDKYRVIDSRIDYVICESPEGDGDMSFDLPFYRVCTGNPEYLQMLEEGKVYVAGQDLVLKGENTELLNGASLSIYRGSLGATVDKDFYAQRIAYLYGVNVMKQEKDYVPEDKYVSEIKNAFTGLEDTYTVIGFNLSFYGKISEDVSVSSMELLGGKLTFDFDRLELVACDASANEGGREADDNVEGIISFNSYSGLFADADISRLGYVCINGEAKKDLQIKAVKSLNQQAVIIDKENHGDYQKLEDEYGLLYQDQKLNYKAGEEMDLTFYYMYEDYLTEDADGVIGSFVLEYEAEGKVYRDYVYQPSVVDGPYLLIPLWNQILSEI